MFQKDFAVYLGQELEEVFTGFASEENFFLILEVEEGLSRQQGRDFLASAKAGIISAPLNNLADFENYINEKVKESNLPAAFSIAAGFVKDNVLYLKTIRAGKIYIYREGKLAPIIEGELSASGYIKPKDIVVFTTKRFMETVGGEGELKGFFDHRKPNEIIDEVTPQLKGKDDQGVIALFVQFKKEEEEPLFRSSIVDKIITLYRDTTIYFQRIGRKKTLTFLAVIFIFFILVWSVGFGVARRQQAAMDKKIRSSKQQIIEKINQAEEAAFLNLIKSRQLIDEAKKERQNLKRQIGKKKEIEELEKLIEEAENKIFKKEQKMAEEFFDLTIDNAKARGNKLYLDSDLATVLDRNGGAIYVLSLSKKSLDKKNFNEIKKAELAASYQDEFIFYVITDGLYKIDSEGKLKRVVEKDKDWENIVGLWIYNGNIYLLDEDKSEIYKYLVAEGGYSAKTSYFKGGTFGLKDANSLTIDSSVYVGFADHIFKFTAGAQDEFKTSFPDPSVQLTKVFTSKDLEKVYAWDKTKGAIYILGKNGTYEREINSDILKKANDFVVYNNAAYILAGSKIYKMSLD